MKNLPNYKLKKYINSYLILTVEYDKWLLLGKLDTIEIEMIKYEHDAYSQQQEQ